MDEHRPHEAFPGSRLERKRGDRLQPSVSQLGEGEGTYLAGEGNWNRRER